jgi:ABC-2 type transport system ATP-binding protein
LLERLDLARERDKVPRELSLGMKRKVALAMGLLREAEVILLDEPLNGLDPAAQREVREILLELRADGRTLLVSSHWLPELERVADTFVLLFNGRVRSLGTLDQLRQSAGASPDADLETLYFELLGGDDR